MSVHRFFSKYVFHLFNLYCFIAGVGVLWIAYFVDNSLNKWSAFVDSKMITVPQVLTAVGLVLLIFAVVCTPCGTLENTKWRLTVISALLAIVLIGEVMLGVLAYHMRNDMEHYALKQMENEISAYNKIGNETTRQFWNLLQADVECCGINGPADWNPITVSGELPTSCCYAIQINQSCSGTNSYTTGCFKKFQSNLQQIRGILIWSGVGFAMVQVFAVFLAFYCKCTLVHDEGYEKI